MSIFNKRVNFKPFEYPEVLSYVDAINHSYWIHTEWNFQSDIHDFHTKLDAKEKNAVKNTLLAISQIEVSVKAFWGKLYDRFPKPEFNAVGATFAESEVRHERAYSHLLEVLNLNFIVKELKLRIKWSFFLCKFVIYLRPLWKTQSTLLNLRKVF